jgi:two-component system, sensor histidine kinase and response regulator
MVFMDLHLPDMDGFQATKLIREIEQDIISKNQKKVPIIAITASTMEEDKQKAQQYTMNDYLLKPFDVQQLQQLILQWVDVRKAINSPLSPLEQNAKIREHQNYNPVQNNRTTIEKVEMNSLLDPQVITKLQQKPKLLSRLSKIYIDTSSVQLETLLQAIEQNNTEQVEAIAPPFKSSSKQMGAIDLGEKLALIEEQGRNGKLSDDIQTLMLEVQKEHNLVIDEIKRLYK